MRETDRVAHRSLWLQEALAGTSSAPSLQGAARADVAIVGGGYVGLWTALRIRELDPACDVVVVEQDVCGGGASGRNGGFALSWWAKLPTLAKTFGDHAALDLCRASEDAVAEIGSFCVANGIDCDYTPDGFLWTACTDVQLGAWDSTLRAADRLGVSPFERLAAGEAARRAGSPAHLDGVFEPTAATVQPALLARGLRRVALERGIRIYEGTRVTGIDRGSPPVLHLASGRLVAERVVFATNAWAAGLRELHTRLVAITSDIVVTEPIPGRLQQIGWTGGEAVSDSQLMVHYYRTTRDGRIAFGKGGWGIALAGRIGAGFDRDARRAADVTENFHRIYPQLRDVAITHDWSGPIDRPADGLPLIGRLGGREHLLYGVGWSGNGVAPSLVGARILASLALGRRDEWSTSPLVDRRGAHLPPEPVRYVGAHIVRSAVVRKERADAAGRRPRRIDTLLAGLAPGAFVSNRD